MEGLNESKIVLTGGAGFIGSHLCENLLNHSAKVYVVDIGYRQNSYFVRQGLNKKTVNFNTDIRNQRKLNQVLGQIKPHFVYHLAAEPIVAECFDYPRKTFETNIMGTVNVLEGIRLLKSIQGVIVASSDKAYGKTRKAYTEDSPLRGDHPYDVSKSAADLIAQAYGVSYKLPIVVTRFGNVYGEGDLHFDRIIPGICKAIIKKETLDIRSNGKYIRDYLYVKDVANGYLLLLQKIKRTRGNVYNFSSQENMSVLELIKKIESILGVKIGYKIKNTAQNEIPYQRLNDTKARKLGWKNKYNLNNTMNKVLSWYRQFFHGEI